MRASASEQATVPETHIGCYCTQTGQLEQTTPQRAKLRTCREQTTEEIVQQTRRNAAEFVWTHFKSVDELLAARHAAMRRFLDDLPAGLQAGRYVPGALPGLPGSLEQFQLALCAVAQKVGHAASPSVARAPPAQWAKIPSGASHPPAKGRAALTITMKKSSSFSALNDADDWAARISYISSRSQGAFARRPGYSGQWLCTPNPGLRGQTPLEALSTEEGFEAVKDLLTKIEQGIYT